MSADLLLAFLRLVLVAALYLFLIIIVVALARDLGPRKAPEPKSAGAGDQASVDANPRARLVVLAPEEHGLPQSFELNGEAMIGRDPASAVHLPPMYVSGRHARIEYASGKWWIEDLGSRNRTYLNGELVLVGKAVSASLGDEISIAGIKLRLSEA